MSEMKIPDMAKVREAVAAIELKRRCQTPDHRRYPQPPSPPAQDAAIRKPLRSHGNPCRSGFNHPDFLHWE